MIRPRNPVRRMLVTALTMHEALATERTVIP